MLSPFWSRLVLRLFGLALLGWSAFRLWFAWWLWGENGDWGGIAQIGAIIIGGWGLLDALTSLVLLAAKNWGRYFAFVTLALHFALTALFVKEGAAPQLKWALAVFAAIAALLVMASNANKE